MEKSPSVDNKSSSTSLQQQQSSNSFDVHELSVRLQKNLLGKLSSRSTVKHIISESSSRFLDQFYRILKEFCGKKEAEKVVRNVVKLAMKLGVLVHNGQLGESELRQLNSVQQKLHNLLMTVISFQQVEFSYDRRFLLAQLDQCQQKIRPLIQKFLSEKSMLRLEQVLQHVQNTEFLDAIFEINGKYEPMLSKLCSQANLLIDNGEL